MMHALTKFGKFIADGTGRAIVSGILFGRHCAPMNLIGLLEGLLLISLRCCVGRITCAACIGTTAGGQRAGCILT